MTVNIIICWQNLCGERERREREREANVFPLLYPTDCFNLIKFALIARTGRSIIICLSKSIVNHCKPLCASHWWQSMRLKRPTAPTDRQTGFSFNNLTGQIVRIGFWASFIVHFDQIYSFFNNFLFFVSLKIGSDRSVDVQRFEVFNSRPRSKP